MSNPRLSLVVGGDPVLGGADPSGAAAPDGSLHLHIHVDREIHLDREGRLDGDAVARDAGDGRPGKGYARPVLLGCGVVALTVVSFYAGQHGRPAASGGAMPAAAIAAAPAARLPFGPATAPVLPGSAAEALPPALRAQLAAPPTVIPPPGSASRSATATAPAGPPRVRNPFGLGD